MVRYVANYLRVILLSTAEVARRLGVSRQRVAQLVGKGCLRPIVQPGPRQSMWFAEEEVERYEHERRTPGRPRKKGV